MKDILNIPLSPPEWLIEETGFGLDDQHIQESLFTLGNGFIGSRGVLEEYPERAMPGTFIAGVYDRSGAQVEELVNLPNPIHFIIAAEGEKLDMNFMGFLKHVRYLDMRKGLLFRRTLFKDGKNRRFLYESVRFFSMRNPHVGWMKTALTLLNGKAELTALDFLDDAAANYGGLIYGTRRHIRLMDADTDGETNYYAYRTFTSKIWVAYADHFSVRRGGSKTLLHDRAHDFEMKAGETVVFTKAFAVSTSLQHRVGRLKEETMGVLHDSLSKGFDEDLREHAEAWKERWENADVAIEGDTVSDRALRLNIYHLIIAAYRGNFPMSIGARALTGQGYRGHIFWDSEIFMLPFYLYTDPATARNILTYRYKRLHQAEYNAEKKGYKGALFPWESGSRGDEATPIYAKDTDGSIIKMDAMDYEHHISADVAYAVMNYYRATDDIEFMLHQGAEMVFSTARFWASRVLYSAKRKKYEIRDVIGPDEFHVRVNNNTFTNMMASWNMEYGHTLYSTLREKYIHEFNNIAHSLRLRQEEAEKWKDISRNMYIPKPKDRIIGQFEGYFRKKGLSIRSYDNFFMPEAPQHISYEDFNKTQFIKQADLLLLFYLLPGRFGREEMAENYRFYIKRTLHQSSLSHSTHALLASKFGDCLRAYALFLFSSQVDLKNLHRNTDGGMHMANAGGVWQAVVFGFAGVGFKDGRISIDPRLPGHWRSLRFKLFWKNGLLAFAVKKRDVEVTYYPGGSAGGRIEVEIYKRTYSIDPFKTIKVRPGKKEVSMVPPIRLKDILRQENFVSVKQNEPVREVSRILRERNVSSVPVVTADRELCGIISKKDIVAATEKEDLSNLKVKDIMNKAVEYVKADDHVEVALRLFTERSFQLLPVVRGKTLVGCIMRKEILSACSGNNY